MFRVRESHLQKEAGKDPGPDLLSEGVRLLSNLETGDSGQQRDTVL